MARNLMQMQKHFPTEYNFFPKTWVLPGESTDFRNHFIKNLAGSYSRKPTYIIKPDGLSQGKGIFLSRNL
jgi:tubulin polyglutamylase TTLL6/13